MSLPTEADRFTGRGYEGAAWLAGHAVAYYEEVRDGGPEYVMCSLDPAACTVCLWGGEQVRWTNAEQGELHALDGFLTYEAMTQDKFSEQVLREYLRAEMRHTAASLAYDIVEDVTHRLEESRRDDQWEQRILLRLRWVPLPGAQRSRPDPEGLSRDEVRRLFGDVRPVAVLQEVDVRKAMASGAGWSAFAELLGDDAELPASRRVAEMRLPTVRGALLRRMHDVWAALKMRWAVSLTASDVLACHNAEHRGRVLRALGYEAFLVSAKQVARIDVRDTDWPNQLLAVDPQTSWAQAVTTATVQANFGIFSPQVGTLVGSGVPLDAWRMRSEQVGPLPPVVLLAVQDATSGRRYLLRVPPATRTVREALAWTFGMAPDAYALAAET